MNHDNDRDDDYEDEDMEMRDDLDFEDDDYEGGILRWVSVVFVIAAVGGFIALAWYAYQSGMKPVSEDEIPYVSGEDTPVKEKPADPGGWQFEHQDKSVYNQLAAGKGANEHPTAERILPAPEEPVERAPVEQILPQSFEKEPVVTNTNNDVTGNSVDTPIPATNSNKGQPEMVISVDDTPPAKPAEEAKPQAEEKVTVVPSSKSEEKTMEVIEQKPQPKAAPAPKPAPVVTPKATAKSGQYMAQLGAFSSNEDAAAAWSKIKAAHGSMFPTKNYAVQRADLGAKGVFYRLQVGPFDSEASVRKVCAYLQEHKQGCFVVKVN